MRRVGWLAGGGLALASAIACAGRFGPARPAELRLSASPDVRWETGGPRELALAVENGGSAPATVAEPSPARVGVAVFAPAEATPICRREAGADGGTSPPIRLAPGERRTLVVRLDGCALAAGEYRYEAWYVPPGGTARGAPRRLGPEHGRIVVQRSEAPVDWPAARGSVSPPDHADAPGVPAPANPHLGLAAPPLGAASLACVDRELARRGLNSWGDPTATVYPGGPPALASDVERQRMILERYPDIGTLCRVPP